MNLKDESIGQIDSRDRRIDSIFIQFGWSFLIMHFHNILTQYFSSTVDRKKLKSPGRLARTRADDPCKYYEIF